MPEGLENLFGFVDVLALDSLCHHRRGGLGYGATGALKSYVFNHAVIVDVQVEGNLVTAQWVESLGGSLGVLQLFEVARTPIVIHHNFLIQVFEIVHSAFLSGRCQVFKIQVRTRSCIEGENLGKFSQGGHSGTST